MPELLRRRVVGIEPSPRSLSYNIIGPRDARDGLYVAEPHTCTYGASSQEKTYGMG
jgi:hypothetical protein